MDKIKKFIAHPLLRNSIVVFAGSMGANIAGWLYHVFIGRILGTESYGELAALLSLFYILNVPSNVLQTVLVKFFSILKAKNELGQAKKLFYSVTIKILIVGSLGLLPIIVFAPFVASFLHIQSFIYVVWLYLIFTTFIVSVVSGSALQGFQLFTAVSILTTVGMTVRLVFGIVFAFFGVGWTLISNIFSNITSYIFTLLPLRFLTKIPERAITLDRKATIGFSIPAFITTLGITLLYSQDVLLVKHYFSSHDAGIYASLSVLGKVIFFASAAVSFVLFPVISERRARGKSHHNLALSGLLVIGLMCAVLTVLYFTMPELVLLAFGKAFIGAMPYLGIFALFITFFSLSSIMVNILLAIDKTAVWVFAIGASLVQVLLISQYHNTIIGVIQINLGVCVGLFFSLLLYYAYGKTKD